MLLREHLEEYTKEQLLEQARSFEMKKMFRVTKGRVDRQNH